MERVWINIHDPKGRVIVEEGSENNVPVINNVLSKQKTKGQKSNVNINDDSWRLVGTGWFSGKSKPVGMVRNS